MNDHTDKSSQGHNPIFDKKTRDDDAQRNKPATDTAQDRTLTNRPADPNAATTDLQIPPGIKPEDAVDPGRATPDAPPVDNRSGTPEKGKP